MLSRYQSPYRGDGFLTPLPTARSQEYVTAVLQYELPAESETYA